MVVRNDLNPATIGYVSPQIVNQTLALSGFERVASFGPRIPSSASYLSAQPLAPGFAPSYPAVEVFQAASPALRPASPVAVLPAASTVLVNGGPDSLLPLAGQGVVTSQPAVIAGDPLPVRPAVWAVTDGQRRADNEFGQTNQNVSFTYTATETNPPDDQFGGAGDPPRQLLPVPAAGHQTVAVLSGAAQVTASSYGDWLVQAPQYDPVNAFDGNSTTAWAEGSAYTPVGQWIQISFDRTLDLPSTIGIQLLVDDPNRSVATRVLVSTAAGSVSTDLADTGAVQALRVRPGATSWLRVTITAASNVEPGAPGAGFTDVLVPGVQVTRYLQPAEDPAGTQAASTVYSFRQQAPSPAAAPGPQASQLLARTFQVPAAQSFSVTAAAVAVPGAALDRLVGSLAPAGRSTFQVSASSTWDSLLEYGPDNLFSGGGPPWIASSTDSTPLLHLTWSGRRTISELKLSPASGAAFPASVEIASPQGTRLASVGPGGVVRVEPPLRTSQLYVIFPGTQSGAAGTGQLPVGLSKLTVPGLAGLRVAAPSGEATFRLACGQGPTVSVDGKQYPTEVSGTVADLVQSLPVQVQLCAPGAGSSTQLSLSKGQHWLLATPSSAFVVTDLDLRSAPDGTAASSVSAATPRRPSPLRRRRPSRRPAYGRAPHLAGRPTQRAHRAGRRELPGDPRELQRRLERDPKRPPADRGPAGRVAASVHRARRPGRSDQPDLRAGDRLSRRPHRVGAGPAPARGAGSVPRARAWPGGRPCVVLATALASQGLAGAGPGAAEAGHRRGHGDGPRGGRRYSSRSPWSSGWPADRPPWPCPPWRASAGGGRAGCRRWRWARC